MSSNHRNLARVEQDSSARPPTLLAGDISPAVMREFKDSCIGYFENKDIDNDKQVRKILAGIKDMRVQDWITAQKDNLVKMTFKGFMDAF
jgi:hypothetical protein